MPNSEALQPDFIQHLQAMSRLIYFVTDEEDRFLVNLRDRLKKWVSNTWVFNPTMGLKLIDEVIGDWEKGHKHEENKEKFEPNKMLQSIYMDDTKSGQNYYVILDPERIFKDEQLVRRVLNIVHSLHNDVHMVKILIFVGPRRQIPEKLSRYMEVVYDRGLTAEEAETLVSHNCSQLSSVANVPVNPPENSAALFRGMTSWEVNAAIAQSIAVTKRAPDPDKRFRIEPGIITNYRRRALKKTDLVQYVDTSKFTFDRVGGAQRFKDWCVETRAAWTGEGRKFGLEPPKGVLAVGVWGCGKSLSVQAMATAWGLPLIGLEMGKLRQGQVGNSEANVYQAINLIERMAPCIVWVDEAEKSLSGGQSSAQTDSGTTSRMIGILSTWMQETESPVCFALTANSLATLPVEFINRVDERFFFDLPSKKDRVEILKIHLAMRNQNVDRFDLDVLAEVSDMMVGREIEQAIKAAMTKSFVAKKSALDFGVLKSCLVKKPRLARTMVDEIRSLVDWVGYDAEADDGIRARYASPPTKKNNPNLQLVGG